MERFWIIKNIFKIHPFYYIAAFITCITGNFKSFLVFSLIIFVHECGHLFAALYFNWNVEKVMILPFGGVTIFCEDINRPLYEEFIILIMGPIFQIVFSFFIGDFFNYSMYILLFNLLPIYPLDGSKFLNIILNKFVSFKKSHLITIYVSFLTIFCVIFRLKFDLIYVMVFSFILYRVIYELKKHEFIFNKFLLERYMNRYDFKKEKVVGSPKAMKRDYRHVFKVKNTYVTEREFLKKRFDFNRKT